jgi:small conductance mechanosensitive channel
MGFAAWLRLKGRLTFLSDWTLMRVRFLLLPLIFAAGSMLAPLPVLAVGLPVPVPSAAAKVPMAPGFRQEGLYNTMPVTVDGVPLFRIAAPAQQPPTALPVDLRASLIENAISQLIAEKTPQGGTIFDPRTFKVEVHRHDDLVEIYATDAMHASPAPILTVTSVDAQYNKTSVGALADQWRVTLQSALFNALEKRQPAQIKRTSNFASLGALVLVLVTILAFVLSGFLWRQAERLEQEIEELHESAKHARGDGKSAVDESQPRQRRRFLALAMRSAAPEHRLADIRALRSLIGWTLVALWLGGITWTLVQFPQTAAFGQTLIRSEIAVAFIWIGAFLLDRIGTLAIGHAAQVYVQPGDTSEMRARRALRTKTITRALSGFKTVVIVFIAVLATASAINIPVASVVTIGGIAALAISFAAQNLVRDVFNGLLVLFEDQYAVGDFVMIGDYNGIVENLTLRIVQIRDSRGNLVTIPHSAVLNVVNASREWSRVDYRVAIDANADLAKAVGTLRETLVALGHDRKWRAAILNPVEWVGIDTMSRNGIVLRAAIRTAPLRQFDVRREVNERVLEAFGAEGIELGIDPLGQAARAPNASPDQT